MITQLNTPLPSPKHVSVLAMNFSFHCCLFEFRTKWTLNVSQSSQNEKNTFSKKAHALLSRVCFERYGVSNEVVSSYRDHHKTISCVAQCGLYLASRLNIYWRVFTVSALCKTNYVSHGSRGALTSPHSLGVVSHKHTNILKTSSAAGCGWAM